MTHRILNVYSPYNCLPAPYHPYPVYPYFTVPYLQVGRRLKHQQWRSQHPLPSGKKAPPPFAHPLTTITKPGAETHPPGGGLKNPPMARRRATLIATPDHYYKTWRNLLVDPSLWDSCREPSLGD